MYSWTPLLVAVRGNHPAVVSLLLKHRPNMNAVDKDGLTALAIACKEGSTDIVYQLVAAGAYVNIQVQTLHCLGVTNVCDARHGAGTPTSYWRAREDTGP